MPHVNHIQRLEISYLGRRARCLLDELDLILHQTLDAGNNRSLKAASNLGFVEIVLLSDYGIYFP